jgi:Raf kinase inhibitor-like YbhB/YbcL family protein
MRTYVRNAVAGLTSLAVLTACGGASSSGESHVPPSMLSQVAAAPKAVSQFTVTSTTLVNNGRIPMSMVNNKFGCHGGGMSPQLSWKGAPAATQSYAVIMFDQTASFGHWGIYNISSATTNLPENVAPRSSLGLQVDNDFDTPGYTGPCPPPGLNHRYVITVYALDKALYLSNSPDFPPFVSALLWSMVGGHVIGEATITGIYST